MRSSPASGAGSGQRTGRIRVDRGRSQPALVASLLRSRCTVPCGGADQQVEHVRSTHVHHGRSGRRTFTRAAHGPLAAHVAGAAHAARRRTWCPTLAHGPVGRTWRRSRTTSASRTWRRSRPRHRESAAGGSEVSIKEVDPAPQPSADAHDTGGGGGAGSEVSIKEVDPGVPPDGGDAGASHHRAPASTTPIIEPGGIAGHHHRYQHRQPGHLPAVGASPATMRRVRTSSCRAAESGPDQPRAAFKAGSRSGRTPTPVRHPCLRALARAHRGQ